MRMRCLVDDLEQKPLRERTILVNLEQLVALARASMENVDADGGWSTHDPEKIVADFFGVDIPLTPPTHAPSRGLFTRAESEAFDKVMRLGEHELTMAKLVKS